MENYKKVPHGSNDDGSKFNLDNIVCILDHNGHTIGVKETHPKLYQSQQLF